MHYCEIGFSFVYTYMFFQCNMYVHAIFNLEKTKWNKKLSTTKNNI